MTLPRYGFEILPEITITTAATVTGIPFAIRDVKQISVEAKFTHGSGGTDVKVFIQTSLDGGVTWIDIMNLRFTTTTQNKLSSVHRDTAVAPAVVPTDGSLANNQVFNGVIGDRVRAKVVSTGTYADDTTLEVEAVAHK